MNREFKTRITMEGERLVELDGKTVARFSIDAHGQQAFSAFVAGVSEQRGSVFDETKGEFLAGTLDQLVEGRPD